MAVQVIQSVQSITQTRIGDIDMWKRPQVFVGSSKEGLQYARAIAAQFVHDDIDIHIWTTVFDQEPLVTTPEQLERLQNFDFGIIVFTPDDLMSNDSSIWTLTTNRIPYQFMLLSSLLLTSPA